MAETVRSGLAAFIERQSGSPVEVLALERWPGGTMRHAWAVDVEIARGDARGTHRLIYLQDRGGVHVGSRLSRAGEFQVLSAAHAAGVRVPRPYWEVRAGGPSGLAPGLILARVEGEVVARRIQAGPALAAVRPRLLAQMGAELARAHAIAPAGLQGLPRPAPGQPAAEVQLAEVRRALAAIDEPHPALELGLRWLGRRPPPAGPLVLVHGDYRHGNFIVDGAEGVRAVLDWELAHLGDPGEDLGWFCMRFWRGVDRPADPGLGPRERFLDGYAAAGGALPGPEALRYWEVLANVRWGAVTLQQARRHLDGHETSLELAAIGRHCAEMEWEILTLLEEG